MHSLFPPARRECLLVVFLTVLATYVMSLTSLEVNFIYTMEDHGYRLAT